MAEIKTLKKLLHVIHSIPHVTPRNIYKVAHYFLSIDEQKRAQFLQVIDSLSTSLSLCPICCMWQEKNLPCTICNDPKRDHDIICIIAQWYDVLIFEKAGGYAGSYHVLGGVISPLDGVHPENLTIEALKNRIVTREPKEIIFALPQTPEGEATAAYISTKLSLSAAVKITTLARGVPVGSSLDHIDRLTLSKALSERRAF